MNATRPLDKLVWFGVLGGAIAFVVQFVASLAFSFAQCNAPAGRWQLPVHGWDIGIGVAAILIALAAETVCIVLYLRTSRIDHVAATERHGEGGAPPTGRINFLAVVGLTVNFLALAIIVMTVIGAPLLPVCQQS